MQEDIENKSVTLVVNGAKFNGRMLKAAIAGFLRFVGNKHAKHQNVKPQGKQSVKKLIGQNQGVSSMDFADDDDIRQFDRFARKYGVDYAIQKVDGEHPRYVLFFKAKDADAITSAFQDYTDNWKNKERGERVSIRQLLAKFKDVIIQARPDRARDRDISR